LTTVQGLMSTVLYLYCGSLCAVNSRTFSTSSSSSSSSSTALCPLHFYCYS
jgi:hypothetical protein